MSILQQGDPQGELCVADIREEGIAVRGREGRTKGVAQEHKRDWPVKKHRNEGFGRCEIECYANNEANV